MRYLSNPELVTQMSGAAFSEATTLSPIELSDAEYFILNTLNIPECILDSGNHFRAQSPPFDSVLILFSTTQAPLCYFLNKIQSLLTLLWNTRGDQQRLGKNAEGGAHRRRAAGESLGGRAAAVRVLGRRT